MQFYNSPSPFPEERLPSVFSLTLSCIQKKDKKISCRLSNAANLVAVVNCVSKYTFRDMQKLYSIKVKLCFKHIVFFFTNFFPQYGNVANSVSSLFLLFYIKCFSFSRIKSWERVSTIGTDFQVLK